MKIYNKSKSNLIKSLLKTTLLVAAAYSPLSLADDQDTLNFVVGITSRYDDNLFRAFDNEQSDTNLGAYAGLRLDKKYSLQRFTADVTITKNKYRNNSYLDYVGEDYKLAWFWALTPRLKGIISANRSQTLNDFSDTRNNNTQQINTAQNIRTTQNQAFLADYNPSGGWHALAGLSRSTNKNSQTFTQDATFSSNAVDFGIKYIFPSNSSLTLMNHVRKGKFDDRQINQVSQFDTGFKEKESELILDWILTAKSKVNLKAGYIRHDSDDFGLRDYSGFTGSLRYDWAPTAKIVVSLDTSSRLSQFQTDTDSFTRNNTISISPRYAMTEKISLISSLDISQRRFLGKGPNNFQNLDSGSRVDDISSISFGAQWTPTLNSTVGIRLQRREVDSNQNVFDYKNNSAILQGNLLF